MDARNIIIFVLLLIIGGLSYRYVLPTEQILGFDEPKTSRDIYNDLILNGCTISHRGQISISTSIFEIDKYQTFMKMSKDCVVLLDQRFNVYNKNGIVGNYLIEQTSIISLTSNGNIYYIKEFETSISISDYETLSHDELLNKYKPYLLFPIESYDWS